MSRESWPLCATFGVISDCASLPRQLTGLRDRAHIPAPSVDLKPKRYDGPGRGDAAAAACAKAVGQRLEEIAPHPPWRVILALEADPIIGDRNGPDAVTVPQDDRDESLRAVWECVFGRIGDEF